MGIPDTLPPAGGISTDSRFRPGEFVVVWPGGVWDWLDPETALEALAIVRRESVDVRLLFPGVAHPQSEQIAPMAVAERLIRRASELGLDDRAVIFGDWAPYVERARYLRGAGAALSLHRAGLESRYAIRSRILDCVWARTPLIATRGDALGEELAERGLAILVEPGDAAGVARAILAWRARRGPHSGRDADPDSDVISDLAPAFAEVAVRYRWPVVARPLAEFAAAPRRAPDHREDDRPAQPNETTARPDFGAASRPAREEEPVTVRAGAANADAALDLPFDQYQRHREAALVVSALRRFPNERLSVLDVGGGPGVLELFLPSDELTSLDPDPARATQGRRHVVGDGSRMSFADGAFDVALSLDTLEHVPPTRRPDFVAECLRVSRRGAVIVAPFADPATDLAENVLYEYIRVALGYEHAQLREHLVNTLPDRELFESQLRTLGCAQLSRPSGYLHSWLTLMLVKHYLMTLPGSGELHRMIDRYYNLHYARADRMSPSYRWLYYLTKSPTDGALDRVSAVLDADLTAGPTPSRPGEVAEALDASRLSLLVQLLALRNGALAARIPAEPALRFASSSADPGLPTSLRTRLDADPGYAIAELNAALAETRRELVAANGQLDAANDLLARIAQGRIMRLLNALGGIVRKR